MTLDFQIRPFTLPMKTSFQRKGLLIYVKQEDGKEAFSEVSPLPGFSKETLQEAQNQLESLREKFVRDPLKVLENPNLFPSVAFGFDSLFSQLSSEITPASYPLCGFLSGSFEEMQEEIPFLLSEGYQHIKLKVAQLNTKNAHQIIQSLLGKAQLKIDVNRAWDLEKSLSFFSEYPLDAFEYIEEPVQDIEDLKLFPYPTALDETLREEKAIPFLPQIKAFILKPMMVGGIKEIQNVKELADQMGASVTLSSSYESGVGLFHLCSMLQRAKIPIHPLGVDTHRLFLKDVLVNPHMIHKGRLTLSPLEVLDVTSSHF